jgi:AcrR family transcriptional regulator
VPPVLVRRESSSIVRGRLIAAAIDILRREGPAATTTGRIAAGAGLKQASFYAHFIDRDACLEAAASAIGERMLARLRAALLPIDVADLRGSIRRVYASLLDVMIAESDLTRMLLAHRTDPASPLGVGMQRDLDRARKDLIDAIRLYGVRATPAAVAMYAEMLVAVMLGLAEAVLAGRVGRDDGIEAAADATHGALRVLLPRTEEVRS